MKINQDTVIVVVGLGYVGLPLAIEFGKKFRTIGFDHSDSKVSHYKHHFDPTGEIDEADFLGSVSLEFSSDPDVINQGDVIVVAVPTPVDGAHVPDFSCLVEASTTVGRKMKRGALIVYESTVYPGATEEVCVPILEKYSEYKWREDFKVAYSPERVNPGDKDRTITQIVKVVSGDSAETLKSVGDLYATIIPAGIHRASSIRVAEAAKVIENTQRDLNIALMNELAVIFDRLEIDTQEVLEAAGTKWNFLPFRPGLVGGHCIGVDPYYLTHKAEMVGYHPQVILAGRRINDGMASFVAQQTLKELVNVGTVVRGCKVVIFGLTFKENCSDIRNSKVVDVVRELRSYGCDVFVHDPIADREEVESVYDISFTEWEDIPESDAIICAVPHKHYLEISLDDLLVKLKPNGVFVDIKSSYSRQDISSRGFHVWRL